ncbi:MAG: cobalt-precorrin 5A hydrolase, partial [Desulfuromonadales bacterium]
MDSVKVALPEVNIAIVAITRGGARLGQQLIKNLASHDFYVSSRYAGQAGADCQRFEPTELRSLFAALWKKYDGFVLIMATGIVVRMIAPLLESKETDPAVVVMDDAGRFAISLISGHIGGA